MASNTAYKVISLSGDPQRYEYVANAALTPGYLVELMSTGKIRKHATAGGVRPAKWFADIKEWSGGTIDTAYAANDQVPVLACGPGDRVYAVLAASAPAIVIGDMLESAGDGTLRKAGNYITDNSGGSANTTEQAIGGSFSQSEIANNFADVAAALNRIKPGVIAVALEAVDNSGGGGEVRIMVELL